MSSRDARSRSVFVGNIPYDATEEQLKEIFQEVGTVASFRLVFDRDSGKAKGYGFCEYRDADTALSAIRNLNGYEINGRQLRVDFAEAEMRDGGGGGGGGVGSARGPSTGRLPPAQSSSSASSGASGMANPVADVTKVLQDMSTQQILEIMIQMKSLVQQNPDQARQILSSNPQVAYGLLQAQILLGFVTPAVAQQILVSTAAASSAPMMLSAPAPQPMGMPPVNLGQVPVPPHVAPSPYAAAPPMGMPPVVMAPPPVAAPYPAPPMPYGVSAPAPAMPALAAGALEMVLAELPLDQRALVVQVLQLSQQQIDMLPDGQRQQIQQVRAMVLGKLQAHGLRM